VSELQALEMLPELRHLQIGGMINFESAGDLGRLPKLETLVLYHLPKFDVTTLKNLRGVRVHMDRGLDTAELDADFHRANRTYRLNI